LNFAKLHAKMDLSGNCLDGHKICGDMNGKSKGVCIPSTEDCPITDMTFGSANPNPGRYDLTKSGTGVNVYYTRSPVK
jgi:hypothetical protein